MIKTFPKKMDSPIAKKNKKSVFLNLASSVGLILALPISLVAFVIWQDSLARQLFVACVLVAVILYALKNEKFITLTLSILFFTQFATSLHTFELNEPLKFQIYFLDILLILWFVSAKEINKNFKSDLIGKIWILLILWMMVSTYFSARIDKSILFLLMMLKSMVVYLASRNLEINQHFIRKTVVIVASILVIQGVVSGLQYIKNDHLGLIVLGERNPEVSKLHYVKDRMRVSGTLGAVNSMGGYIAMLMVFLTPFVLSGKRNILLYTIYGASFITLIIPFSRAGWLSFFLGAVFCIFNLFRSKSISAAKIVFLGLITSFILAGVVFVFLDKIQDRFEDKRAVASAEGRVGQFIEAMDVIKRYPITGIGPGITDFFGAWKEETKYVQKALPGVKMYNQYHNNFLQIWVENGVLGALLFLCFLFLVMLYAINPPTRKRPLSLEERLFLMGASAAAFSYLVHTSFGPEINNDRLLVSFALLLGFARNKKFIA